MIVGVISWVTFSGLAAFHNISAKNNSEEPSFFKFTGDIPPDQLKREGDGRINVLLIGADQAAGLTDSLEVYSIDPVNSRVVTVSLPRDFYVNQPGGGKAKINAVYNAANSICQANKKNCDPKSDAGADALKTTVAGIMGIPIHFYARVDFQGFEQFINAINGIQVYVDKPLNDPFFPDAAEKGYAPVYFPAGLQTFNGKKALEYARSRETTSDFDRSRRQQQIISVAKDKVLSLNVLTNPKKISDLFSILGGHLRTDISIDDSKQILAIVKKITSEGTSGKVLDTNPDSPLRSTNDPAAGYIIFPKLGVSDYRDLQDYVASFLPEPYLIREKAKVAIVNASGSEAIGKSVSAKLKAYDYTITSTTTASLQKKSALHYYNTDKPYTLALLKRRFNLTPIVGTTASRVDQADIVLVIGNDYRLK